MAKKQVTSIKRKVKRKVNKVKKNKTVNLVYTILVIAIAIIAYLYISQLEEPTYEYSSEQNSEGFYYYQYESSNGYYYTANDLIGDNLKQTLHTIINDGFVAQNYEKAKEVLVLSDLKVGSTDTLYGLYLGNDINAVWDSGATWDREHVWPNSRLGIPRVNPSSRNQGTDLHNLRAINGSINSTRSDHYFVNGSGQAKLTGDGFYPGDDHKGDVARILFYMVIMYDFLTLKDEDINVGETYTMDRIAMGELSVLLEWHKQDPVDEFEINRNQVIFEAQGNRNPFIDKPVYAHLIFENKTINELLKPVETGFYQPRIIPSFILKIA